MSQRHQILIGIFILLGALAYGTFQWSERSSLLIQAEALTKEATNLTSLSKNLAEDYQAIKVGIATERETAAQELSVVFPTDEDLTTLTRLLDDFSVKNNFDTNPFFISSLSYDEAQMSESGNSRYLPLQLRITTSKKNLSKFFEFIENSGSLEGETRLMSIEDLTLTYPSEFGGSYEVQMTLYAYFSPQI